MATIFAPANEAAIKAIGAAGGKVDTAIRGAARKDAVHADLVRLLQCLAEAAQTLQRLSGAEIIERSDGEQHASAAALNQRLDHEDARVRQIAKDDCVQVESDRRAALRELTETALNGLRRFFDFAVRPDGSFNLKGLGLTYLGGALALGFTGTNSGQVLVLAICGPLGAWATAWFAEERLEAATNLANVGADEKRRLIQQRCDGELNLLSATRAAELRKIEQGLADRLGKLASIVSQADTMLTGRALQAENAIRAWARIQAGLQAARVAGNGYAAPPPTLDLGKLRCSPVAPL